MQHIQMIIAEITVFRCVYLFMIDTKFETPDTGK